MDLEASPLDYMLAQYPEVKEREEMRKIVGRFGITGKQQTTPIKNLSDGQRVSCKICICLYTLWFPKLGVGQIDSIFIEYIYILQGVLSKRTPLKRTKWVRLRGQSRLCPTTE